MRKSFYLFKRNGSSNWYVQFRDLVTDELETAQTTGQTNKTRAEAWARAEWEKRLDASKKPDILLSDYAEPFFVEGTCPHEKRRKADGKPFGVQMRREYRRHLKEILKDPIASMKVADIRRADALAFRDRVIDRRGRTRSAHTQVQTLKVILHMAIDDGLLDHDPTIRLKVVPEKVRSRVVTDEEGLVKLLAPENWDNPILREAAMTGALVGLRAGELRGLRWEDLDTKAGAIRVCRSITDLSGVKLPKWEKVRVASYPVILQKILEKRRGTGWVFAVSTQGPLSYITLSNAMTKAAEQAKIPGLTLHGLRHSIQTILRGKGIPSEVLRATFGWSNERMQDGYTHRELYDIGVQNKLVDRLFKGKV